MEYIVIISILLFFIFCVLYLIFKKTNTKINDDHHKKNIEEVEKKIDELIKTEIGKEVEEDIERRRRLNI